MGNAVLGCDREMSREQGGCCVFSQVKSECVVQSSDNGDRKKSNESDLCGEVLSQLKLE